MNLEKIEKIIEIEWKMMQNVDNIGGRASCQDDNETFYIMRRSQYENWSEEMIDFFLDFAIKSETEGRNLVAEKYGKMMAYTNLHYYNKHLKHLLPATPLKNFRIINDIVEKLILWEEDFAAKHPLLADTGRPIRSKEDYKGFTSMETYARGELETYSEELLLLYRDYVNKLYDEEKSLSLMNQLTMVQLYGYDSIEEAENSLK